VIAAIGTVNSLEWVGEAMYHTLHSLLQVDSTWVQATLPADCLARYGTRFDDFRLPRDAAKRQALAETIGADGMAVLNVLFAPETPAHVRLVPAVDVLCRLWLQQYWTDQSTVRWRQEADLLPTAQLIVSPYDPDARFGIQRDILWTGYKVHRDL
jgi:transposase